MRLRMSLKARLFVIAFVELWNFLIQSLRPKVISSNES